MRKTCGIYCKISSLRRIFIIFLSLWGHLGLVRKVAQEPPHTDMHTLLNPEPRSDVWVKPTVDYNIKACEMEQRVKEFLAKWLWLLPALTAGGELLRWQIKTCPLCVSCGLHGDLLPCCKRWAPKKPLIPKTDLQSLERSVEGLQCGEEEACSYG